MILYQDDWLCVVNKVGKLQTHETPLDPVKDNLVDRLQAETGLRFNPVHRLDRGTSGVLMLAKDVKHVAALQSSLQNYPHKKIYTAIIRGQVGDSGIIVREMQDPYTNKLQYTKSTYSTVSSFQAKIPVGRHPLANFSMIELEPITGRTHQLRRHLSKISRPILGDMEYGDSSLNKFFRHEFGDLHLLLHATELKFWHPFLQTDVTVSASLPDYFKQFTDYCRSTL
jgi:tRNA pseudouridine65 synthase